MADRNDFESWYRREHPVLLRSLWALSGDRDLAVEVVDEACSRALARWNRVSGMESPGGWVHTTALNLLRRTTRRRALEDRILRRSRAGVQPEPLTADTDLWRAVASLPPRQREVIVLRYVADCPEAEVASILGISEGAASASLSKARGRLAEMLATEEEMSQ